jgi:hypothetical protein
MFINASRLYEHTSHHFVTEASSLLWRQGVVPEHVATDLGNGRDLILQQYDNQQFLYRQLESGIEVTVYSD